MVSLTMKLKRSHLSLIALVILGVVWFAANQRADRSLRQDFAKAKIASWKSELWIKHRFKDVKLGLVKDSARRELIEATGTVATEEDLRVMREWFESPPVFEDILNYENRAIPPATNLVRYRVAVNDLKKPVETYELEPQPGETK